MDYMMKKATEIIEGMSNKAIENIQINYNKRHGFTLRVWFVEGTSEFEGKLFKYDYDREQFEFVKNF